MNTYTYMNTYIHTQHIHYQSVLRRRALQCEPSESPAAGGDPRPAVHLRPANHIQDISICLAIYLPGEGGRVR